MHDLPASEAGGNRESSSRFRSGISKHRQALRYLGAGRFPASTRAPAADRRQGFFSGCRGRGIGACRPVATGFWRLETDRAAGSGLSESRTRRRGFFRVPIGRPTPFSSTGIQLARRPARHPDSGACRGKRGTPRPACDRRRSATPRDQRGLPRGFAGSPIEPPAPHASASGRPDRPTDRASSQAAGADPRGADRECGDPARVAWAQAGDPHSIDAFPRSASVRRNRIETSRLLKP